MKYLVLFSIIAVAYAELQPIQLPPPALPEVVKNAEVQPIVVPKTPSFAVHTVEISEQHVLPENVVEKVQDALNFIFEKIPQQEVKITNDLEAPVYDKVKVVEAPLELENEGKNLEIPQESVKVADAVNTPVREQLRETPIVVNAPVFEVPEQFEDFKVKVVDQPRGPGKVYDNPMLRSMA